MFAEIIGWELLLVVGVIALLFGSKKIPELARSLGQASKEFRKGVDSGADDGTENAAPTEGAAPTGERAAAPDWRRRPG